MDNLKQTIEKLKKRTARINQETQELEKILAKKYPPKKGD